MSLQRVDRLKEPPVVGRVYLVPMVHGRWYDLVRDWPVIGLRHNDIEFFNFPKEHYHIDRRFARVSARVLHYVTTAPLHGHADYPLRKPTLKRRMCLRAQHVFGGPAHYMDRFRAHYANQQCSKGKRGFVCPHRQFPLGSTPAIDGVITCPLHGLRVDATTGKCLSASDARESLAKVAT